MQIEEKGDLILKLMLSNDGPSPAYISVKFGDKTREVKVPPTGSHIQYILVDAGIFTVDYPGFYSVWIKPISKSGQYFPGIMNVQLCAPFADKINFPTIPDRNAPTVNLTYLNPQKKKVSGMVVNALVPNNFDYTGTRIAAIGNEVFKVGMANETKGRYIYLSWKKVKGYEIPQFQYSQFKSFLLILLMKRLIDWLFHTTGVLINPLHSHFHIAKILVQGNISGKLKSSMTRRKDGIPLVLLVEVKWTT